MEERQVRLSSMVLEEILDHTYACPLLLLQNSMFFKFCHVRT